MGGRSLDRGPLYQNVPRAMCPLRFLLQPNHQNDKKPTFLLPCSVPLYFPGKAQRRCESSSVSTSGGHQEHRLQRVHAHQAETVPRMDH